jgi:hypothetical protein
MAHRLRTRTYLAAGLAFAAVSAVIAAAPDDARAGAAPAPVFQCPPSGYHPPMYGVVGRNGGDGPQATEALSPCVLKEVVAAADAIGMARSFGGSPLGVKNITTEEITFTGRFAKDGTRMVPVERLDLQIHYGLPAARLMIDREGPDADIRVFNDERAWNEETEGGEATAANAAALRERLLLTKLTPAGALWSLIEAEAHAKVAQVGGRTVITGASPYDNIPVSVTLDADNFPAAVTVRDGRTTYGATFANFSATPDKSKIDWEPDNGVRFAAKVTWTKNGRPFGDFTTTRYFSNAYVVFPVPANLR